MDNDIFMADHDRTVENCCYFEPYENNGGTLVAIAGPDFATIACDTRLTDDMSICARDENKLFQMGPRTVVGTCGCWCDALAIVDVVGTDAHDYVFKHSKPISTDAFAQMLSISLYSRRFFPYYVTSLVAGVDSVGKGAVYNYDPLGHLHRSKYNSVGSSSHIILPVLDTLVDNLIDPITIPYALYVLAHSYNVAADIDVFTGDSVIVNIITKNGIVRKRMPLRVD